MMPLLLDSLIVWWDRRQAGELAIDKDGAMHFAYSAEWLADDSTPPLSQALPKRSEAFDDRVCKAVFGGLLPEESQRTAIARALGVSPDNPFRLLQALGGDVAGAFSFLPAGEEPLHDNPSGDPEPLDESELPVVLTKDRRIAVPRLGESSTHLIKPEPERFAGLAANEAFCLALARAVGLNAARAEWRQVQGKPLLLVERYDRVSIGGRTQRLHQEDFAQALAVPSSRKYAAEGGPTFFDSFALVRSAATRPAREVLKLADASIFNLIVGNADAHAKNYSLLRLQTGEVVLAPLYDLVATHIWKELSPRLAMRFGRAATIEELGTDNLERFSEDAGLSAPFVKRRLFQIAEALRKEIGKGVIVPGLDDQKAIAPVAEAIVIRAALATQQLS